MGILGLGRRLYGGVGVEGVSLWDGWVGGLVGIRGWGRCEEIRSCWGEEEFGVYFRGKGSSGGMVESGDGKFRMVEFIYWGECGAVWREY